MDKIYEQFINPDVFYRPAPFWIWNEEMEADEAIRQMEEFKKCGMGGAFEHVRNGLISEYLGEQYFDVFDKTLEAAKKMGAKLYMYDEYAWPSGSAGGRVLEALGDRARGSWMACEVFPSDTDNLPEGCRLFAYDEKTKTIGKELTGLSKEERAKASEKVLRTYVKTDWGFNPYVDISKPDVIEKFIEVTYEEYYKRFGKDFKEHMMAMFSDEASVVGLCCDDYILWSDTLVNKFYEMHGYRIEDNFLAVYDDFNGNFEKPASKIRYDYTMTLHELWMTSFVKPIAKWCEEHDIAWTGHDQEHSWPLSKGHAFSEQNTYEYRQWPGIDLLLCDALKDVPAWNDTLLMGEVKSAANQFGKKRTICEIYGAAGWQPTFQDFKRLGDWIYVHGINFMIQHLSHYSLVGNRKTDCPLSIDWRQPWWGEYKDYNDYFGKLSYMLSQGKMEQRILVLNPTTTAYMIAARKQKGIINHSYTPNCIKNPDMTDLLKINQKLIDGQWDFDWGDEFSIEDNARVEGKKFVLGLQKYEVIVVSKNMRNFKSSTVKLLLEFIKNGGTVISTGDACEFIDGEVHEDMTAELRKAWTVVDGESGVAKAIEDKLKKRIVFDREIPTGVTHMRRVLDDGREEYFFVNHSMKTYEANVTVKGDSAAKWDLFTGEKEGIPCKKKCGKITFNLKLEWNQSLLVVVGDKAEIKAEKPNATKNVAIKLNDIKAEKENLLMLDHCKLICDGKEYPERYFLETGRYLCGARDIQNNIWDGTQVRTIFLDKNKNFKEGSGFKVVYGFTIKDGCMPEKISALVERAAMITLTVNGKVVKWTGETSWIDFRTGVYDIKDYVHEGYNEIVISMDKFDVRFEVAGVILEGEFGVAIEGERFVIVKKPEKLTYGSWLDQNYYFYPNAMLYSYEVDLAKKPENAKLLLGDGTASCASVTVNGQYAGIIGKDGDNYANIEKYLKEGKNEFVIRVSASFRNIYGPFFKYTDQTVAVGDFFRRHETDRINRPEEYQFMDYGLFEEPKLIIND